MRSPWTSFRPLEPDRRYVALATSIPTRRVLAAWRMFRGAAAVRRQLATTDGVVGFSLLASPLRKRYATLSVWEDDEALARFAAASPHREIAARLAPEMGATRFVRWTVAGADGVPGWPEALDRLA